MLIILRSGSSRNKLSRLANTHEWHPATGADERCLAHKGFILCHHWEGTKEVLSALFLGSWFKLDFCQHQGETHFHSFVGTWLKELRRSIQKACSEMAFAWPGGFGSPISSHSQPPESSSFMLWITEMLLCWTSRMCEKFYNVWSNPREVSLVQTPMDTYSNSNIY